METSALRVAARGTRTKPDLVAVRAKGLQPRVLEERTREVHFGDHGWLATRVVDRSSLAPGDALSGPAIVDQLDSTIVLPPGTSAIVDEVGNMIISIDEATA